MPIRIKIGVILCAALFCLIVAEYGVQRFVVLPGFYSLERDEAVKDADRVLKALQNEIAHLNTFAWDWSAWDDTYDFVQSRSDAYITSNLVPTTFFANHLNVIYIYDANGRMIWGKVYDLNAVQEMELALFPKEGLPAGHPMRTGNVSGSDQKGDIQGLVLSEAGPMVVAAVPILKSNYDGPSRGTLIMGRFLDETMVAQIAKQTQVKFSLTGIPGAPPCGELTGDRKNGFEVYVGDDDLLHVHAAFPDISGKPAVAVSTSFARQISRKGQNTVRNSILLILAAGAGILVLISLSLKKIILNPLSALSRHVLFIKKTGDLSRRLRLFRNDEIGTLARECDNMVARLEKMVNENEEINIQLRKDIERRRQVEAALAASERQFRAMIDQAGDAVFLYDSSGKIRIVNQAACHRLGYDRENLLNLTIRAIEPEAVSANKIATIREQMDFHEPEVVETRHQRRDKLFIPVEVSRTCIQYGGESLILSIARDLTERKLMDEQIRQSRKMAAMTTLTAGIAHNFNNLLSVILGSAELALAKMSGDHPAVTLLKRIQSAGDRAKETVWQLIRFGKINDQAPQSIFAAAVIETQITQMQSAILSDKIKIIRHLDAHCRPLLNDPGDLRIIVENLLTNAVESFSDGRGVIEVVLEAVAARDVPGIRNGHSPQNTFVRLIVRDNGQGIDPAHLDRIFDPYFTTKNFAGGAGMGLSVVHGIVAGNSGVITADSRIGRGTEVTIFLPAADMSEKISDSSISPL